MSARRMIIAALSEDSLGGIATLQDVDRAEALVDALVAEVRREDAAYIVAIQERVEADEIAEHGSLDHESELQGQAVRTMAAHLRAKAGRPPAGEEATAPAATATPDFFQPGRTYTRGIYAFRCLIVTADPNTGEPRAVGLRSRNGFPWDGAALDPDDWAHGDWTDTTNTETDVAK